MGEYSTELMVDASTTADTIRSKLMSKSTSQNNNHEKKHLYVVINNPKKIRLVDQILRVVKSHEKILELEQILNSKKISHEYHSIAQAEYKQEKLPITNELNEKFFKSNKWDRVGELLKKSEKMNEESKEQFNKKMFYLGNDILYYLNKNKDSILLGRL